MFTGIIQHTGLIQSVVPMAKGGIRATIRTSLDLGKTAMGASICCSGACLTVVKKGNGRFSADISGETLECTTLGEWQEGTEINLEPSLKLGDELGGHIVTGHVDGVAVIKSVTEAEGSREIRLKAPKKLAKFIAAKGSVTLDGISLTVNAVKGRRFRVNLIPHTWEATTLRRWEEGTRVNLEVDILARYVVRMAE